MSDVPAHVLQAAPIVASEDSLTRARELATRYHQLLAEIEGIRAVLSERSEELQRLQYRELPDLFSEVGISSVGVDGAVIEVVPFYKANIAADWPQERRDRAFNWLESNEAGDIIGTTVTVAFQRGQIELARQLEASLREQPWANSNPPVLQRSVPWNTLTALVRERLEQGKETPLEDLGATVGRVARVKSAGKKRK